MKLLPLLDTERPEDSVEIEEKDLTISVIRYQWLSFND